jgi:multicomponent Na+:H+ antiporter subunit F
MSVVLWVVSIGLLLQILAGLVLLGRGKGGVDAVLVLLLLGSTGVALVAVLAFALPLPRALDVGLVFGLLAAVLGVTFARRGWPLEDQGKEPPP